MALLWNVKTTTDNISLTLGIRNILHSRQFNTWELCMQPWEILKGIQIKHLLIKNNKEIYFKL